MRLRNNVAVGAGEMGGREVNMELDENGTNTMCNTSAINLINAETRTAGNNNIEESNDVNEDRDVESNTRPAEEGSTAGGNISIDTGIVEDTTNGNVM